MASTKIIWKIRQDDRPIYFGDIENSSYNVFIHWDWLSKYCVLCLRFSNKYEKQKLIKYYKLSNNETNYNNKRNQEIIFFSWNFLFLINISYIILAYFNLYKKKEYPKNVSRCIFDIFAYFSIYCFVHFITIEH